jgi:hypothetical protein
MKNLFFIPVLGILLCIWSCGPSIHLSTIHPDSDKEITFTIGKGKVKGNISEMQLEIEGSVVATQPGEHLSYTGGPYPSYSNRRMNYKAIAKTGSSSKETSGWVFVANPKNVFSFNNANGSNEGYPNSTTEQTGANLYRLDKSIVRNTAQDALMEYSNNTGKHLLEVSNIADEMVAAVAFYVDRHMQWRNDSINRVVFSENGWETYSPGWDFPQPADLTLTISGNLTNASTSDDYMGDCEDFAILRAALLRALGFAPWAIWNVIDFHPDGLPNRPNVRITHEYNVVLYEGAYRIMDYGNITRWLSSDNHWISHESHYGWNEENGPRGTQNINHEYLKNNTNNFPGGKQCPGVWSNQKYYNDVCE